MNACDIFRNYALYNKWANEQLCAYLASEAAPLLKAKDARTPSDIIILFNHALWEERLWMHRASGYGQEPHPTNKVLYPVFEKLCAALEEEDMWLKNFTHNLTAPTLDTVHRYRNLLGQEEHAHLYEILTHIFDQQSFARGQICQILTQHKLTPPNISLSHFITERK